MSGFVPVLRTERLVLRAFTPHDFETFANIVSDPEVVRYLDDGAPITAKSIGRINVERLAQVAALHDAPEATRTARALRAALEAALDSYPDAEAAVSDACVSAISADSGIPFRIR